MGWCSCWKGRFIGRLIQQSFTVFLCAKCLTLSSSSDERGDSLQLVKWFWKKFKFRSAWKVSFYLGHTQGQTTAGKPSWWICVLGWRGSHSFSCSWPKHKMKEKHSLLLNSFNTMHIVSANHKPLFTGDTHLFMVKRRRDCWGMWLAVFCRMFSSCTCSFLTYS